MIDFSEGDTVMYKNPIGKIIPTLITNDNFHISFNRFFVVVSNGLFIYLSVNERKMRANIYRHKNVSPLFRSSISKKNIIHSKTLLTERL